jgi:hypothetical protein
MVGSVTVSVFRVMLDSPRKQRPVSVVGGPAGLPDSTASPSKPVSVALARNAVARRLGAPAMSRGACTTAAA